MARSSSSVVDWVALAGIAAGLVIYVAPFFGEGRLRLAFWLTLAATVLHIFTSHAGLDAGGEGGRS